MTTPAPLITSQGTVSSGERYITFLINEERQRYLMDHKSQQDVIWLFRKSPWKAFNLAKRYAHSWYKVLTITGIDRRNGLKDRRIEA